MRPILPLIALTALALSGCTHLGTNIAGSFSCRAKSGLAQGPGCQPLSEVDAKAIRQLLKAEGGDPGASFVEARQRIALAASDPARTGERTLKVVFPAHVDPSGTLHEEAVAWAVVEAARWAGELKRTDLAEPKGPMRALRQALKDQARRAQDAARKSDAETNLKPPSPEDSAPAETANPFIPSSPLVLPSPGGEAPADVANPVLAPSAAGGSDMSPTPHDRAPRPSEQSTRVWPSAAAIEAAKALKAKGSADTGTAPSKEPK